MSRFRRNGTCSKSGWRFRPRARRHRPRKTGERAITAPCDTKTASVRPVDATVGGRLRIGGGVSSVKKGRNREITQQRFFRSCFACSRLRDARCNRGGPAEGQQGLLVEQADGR